MPEIISFRLPADSMTTLADLAPDLPAPIQILGPTPSGNGDGWTAYVVAAGSVRGLTVASEPAPGARRVELRREAGASSADFRLYELLARRMATVDAAGIQINGEPVELAALDEFFAPGRLSQARASEWRLIYDRFFRAGRGRAVLTSPLFELTVHLEDVTFRGGLEDHLEELEARLAARVEPLLAADVVNMEQGGEGAAAFRFARWSTNRRTLVPEVDRVLVVKGAPVGFVALATLSGMLGPRAEVPKNRPPRRILLPALDPRNDFNLLALIEKTARARPPGL